MTVHLVTFSDESMSRSRDLCIESALSRGGVDSYRRYSPWDIKGHACGLTEVHELYGQHKKLFDAPRGCGYWAWKPLLLYYYVLQYPPFYGINEGDVIVYSDAGIEFINHVSHIIDRMDQDIFLFGNNWEHAHWCKRDVIDAVWPYEVDPWLVDMACSEGPAFEDEHTWYRFGKQCQASVIFFRVSDYSKQFVAEWLKWCLHRTRFSEGVCTDEWRYLIDDSPSIAPNHPEFREHRHDQAILTTLAYREGIKLHYWPASYNNGAFVYEKIEQYRDDDYPILFNHHRRRNHEWENAA